MKKIKIIYILTLGLLINIGCSDEILDLKNPNEYDTGTFFNTEEELEQATNAVYGSLYFGGLWSREYYFIYDLLGNDAQVATALQGELAEFAKYTYNAAHGQINVYWRSLYRIALRANLVIDKSEEYIATNGNSAKVERFIAEAKFLRGWAYFELVSQFGRVPLKKSLQDLEVIETPRSDEAEVWAIVEQDLKDAMAVLPDSYDGGDLGRATSGAAIALLGKAYLYQQKYPEAAAELAKIENRYSLIPGNQWNDNFTDVDALENNAESVFDVQLKFIPGTNTWYMFGGQESWGKGAAHTGRPMEYGFNDWQNVYISDAAVNLFQYKDDAGNDYIDPRAAKTFYGGNGLGDDIWCDDCGLDSSMVSKDQIDPIEWELNDYQTPLRYNLDKRGYRFKKYQNYEKLFKESLPEGSNNGKVIRFADVLLMRAEALIMTGDIAGGIALINRVRDRVGAFQYNAGVSQAEAVDLLKRERHLELCGEQSRYRDLVRWGDAKSVLNVELNTQYSPGENKSYFLDKHVLFPIPQSEKDLNPAVVSDVANDWN